MKANELMIGDWVKDKYKPKPHRVNSCADFNSSEDLSPIPLTPEILEKNGFKFHSFGGDYKWERPEFVINDSMIDSVGKNNFHYEYVHELQHAFRLCELDELADNFQI